MAPGPRELWPADQPHVRAGSGIKQRNDCNNIRRRNTQSGWYRSCGICRTTTGLSRSAAAGPHHPQEEGCCRGEGWRLFTKNFSGFGKMIIGTYRYWVIEK
jgi:hypothetical protein